MDEECCRKLLRSNYIFIGIYIIVAILSIILNVIFVYIPIANIQNTVTATANDIEMIIARGNELLTEIDSIKRTVCDIINTITGTIVC